MEEGKCVNLGDYAMVCKYVSLLHSHTHVYRNIYVDDIYSKTDLVLRPLYMSLSPPSKGNKIQLQPRRPV